MNNKLTIAGRTFKSRLIIGSARFPNPDTMGRAIEASGAEMVTVAIRRVDLKNKDKDRENILNYINKEEYFLLPNTAGCFTARDAVLTAQLAREALETDWIKLEVIGDEDTLFPDVPELLKAAEQLWLMDLPCCLIVMMTLSLAGSSPIWDVLP